MIVNFLSYLAPGADPGGGGAVRDTLIEVGRTRGHLLQCLHRWPIPRLDADNEADLWILSDVWNAPWHWKRFHRRAWAAVPGTPGHQYKRLVEAATESNFVHVDNAYVDVCDLPYLPCNGTATSRACPYKRGLTPRSRMCFRMENKVLYQKSLLNFFVSPLHRRVVVDFLGLGTDGRNRILRPVLNATTFAASGGELTRDIDRIFVGSFVPAKGSRTISARWPSGEVTVVGPETPDAIHYPGYSGRVDYDEVALLMRRARTFVFFPRWPEPFGRVVAEAAVSGCELETNDRVGALSFDADLRDPSLYEGAASEFWATLEALPQVASSGDTR